LIRSMTGFGEASSQNDGVYYFLELRSLNNRYFKGIIRMPDEFQGLEAEIEAELRRRLNRGSVTLTATCTDTTGQSAYTINHLALANYIDQLRKTPQVASGEVKIEIGPLLGLPGVTLPPTNEEARLEKARAAFMGLLDRACGVLLKMREREGSMLRDDLVSQRDLMAERLEVIKSRAPASVRDYEQRLRQRIQMMLQDAELKLSEVDLIREIAVYAERSDISEEITRLQGHLEQYIELLSVKDDKPVGRTLDFLAQEMLREANTMASKSSDSTMSKAIVEIKGAIDRIKEQVQNIE